MEFQNSIRICWLTLVSGWLCLTPLLAFGERPESNASKTISRIPPGTIVGDPQAVRWNRVILLARPRMASGETDALSENVRTAATKFTLSILASVVSSAEQAAGSPSASAFEKKYFKLDDVGVGHAIEIGGNLTIVSTSSATRLGVKLGFLESRVLAENEKQLTSLRLIAKTNDIAILDAAAIMLRDGDHYDFTVRHLIWVERANGRTRTLVWLLRKSKNGENQVVDEPLRLLAPGTREDRAIHVDGSKFFLGIPSQRSFAIEHLPPGRPLKWSNELKDLAAINSYTVQQLDQLSEWLKVTLSPLDQ